MQSTLKMAKILLNEAKAKKKLGLLSLINDDEEMLRMIAQQVQGLMSNGEYYNDNKLNLSAYHNLSKKFGQPLIRAAIQWYNS